MLLRTVFIYFVVYLVLRLMGKREIGKLSVFDLVISIMVAEIAVIVIEDTKKKLLEGLLPLATLVLLQIIFAYLAMKSEKLRRIIDGKPTILIRNGKLNRKAMKKQKYNLDDLLLQLRMNDVINVKDVEFAILETNGSLSVIPKDKLYPPAAEEKNGSKESQIRYEGLPLSLILDGKVQDHHLEQVGKTRFWLKNELQKQGLKDFRDVFFCSVDHRGEVYIDPIREDEK